MEMETVVFGCPVANRSWCIPKWAEAVARQTVNERWHTAFVYTESEDDTLVQLHKTATRHEVYIINGGESPRTREEMDLHRWPEGHFASMAEWRNMLLDHAIEQDAEWFFSVDSDIILPPLAFVLLKNQLLPWMDKGFKAIAPLVNMASHIDAHAYNYMDWTDIEQQALRPQTPMPETAFPAGVIMAAMLIHRSAFHVKWATNPQGEDLGWSWNARQEGVRLLVDPTVTCNHLMRRSQ